MRGGGYPWRGIQHAMMYFLQRFHCLQRGCRGHHGASNAYSESPSSPLVLPAEVDAAGLGDCNKGPQFAVREDLPWAGSSFD